MYLPKYTVLKKGIQLCQVLYLYGDDWNDEVLWLTSANDKKAVKAVISQKVLEADKDDHVMVRVFVVEKIILKIPIFDKKKFHPQKTIPILNCLFDLNATYRKNGDSWNKDSVAEAWKSFGYICGWRDTSGKFREFMLIRSKASIVVEKIYDADEFLEQL